MQETKIKYTAFVDILGFSNFIKNTITNDQEAEKFSHEVSEQVGSFLKYSKEEDYPWDDDLNFIKNIKFNYAWVSDTFVVSLEYNGNSSNNNKKNIISAMLIYILSLSIGSLCHYFIKNYKLCLRGAVTSKFTFLRENLLLGEGISEAHYLESEIAVNPRVIFSTDIITDEIFKILSLEYNDSDLQMISKDSDGYYFVNYLNVLKYIPPMIGKMPKMSPGKIKQQTKEDVDSFFYCHKEMIEEELKQKNLKVFSKFLWLKEYHNRTVLKNKYSNDLVI